MTFDPTTTSIVFGLLSETEQQAIKAWPHGWLFYRPEGGDDPWASASGINWYGNMLYRGKPAPVKFDPTLNCVPFGLLTPSQRQTLRDWPHGLTFYDESGHNGDKNIWSDVVHVHWHDYMVYRGKPAPQETET